MSDPALELAMQLISRPSVTPEDAGCQEILAARLRPLGFRVEHLRFGAVANLWARLGTDAPLLVFAGHTDVVPTGPVSGWRFDPFTPTVADGHLYGRGAADMKSSLAAFVVAIEQFLAARTIFKGSIGLLITSDEEGPAVDGTVRVVELLRARGERIRYCVVGEPTSEHQCGDTLKNGRRGSLSGEAVVHGVQGHVAYPHLARNPIHDAARVISDLATREWDHGNGDFPPTSFQVSNIQSGTGASNVIPGEARFAFNFRHATASPAETLKKLVDNIFTTHCNNYDINWAPPSPPYLTAPGRLVEAALEAVRTHCDITAKLSTSGGTSDGRFIAQDGSEVVELGPLNATIHQRDERVRIDDPRTLAALYLGILERLL
jgi:succinyl-diaminopimelate desuccinylase